MYYLVQKPCQAASYKQPHAERCLTVTWRAANELPEYFDPYRGSLREPKMSLMMSVESLRGAAKWTKFGLVSGRVSFQEQPLKQKDLFTIKRGLATGANDFFVLTPAQVSANQLPLEFLKPVLPSPRLLSVDEIVADRLGNPILVREASPKEKGESPAFPAVV